MLPWLNGHLATIVNHVYLGQDGDHYLIPKSQGGDQGDAVTAVIFPMVYRTVTRALIESATAIDPDARDYAYQDDVELICIKEAYTAASAAFELACNNVKLRANLKKTSVTAGREVRPGTLPASLVIEPRAIVLKHGGGSACAVPAQEASNAADGSLRATDSPELRDL